MRRLIPALAFALTFGCASETEAPAPTSETLEYLTPTQHLVRASMALRGVRPSVDELTAVEEDPRWLEPIIDHYLTTPEFGETVRELHDEALLLRVDPVLYPAGFAAVDELEGEDLQRMNISIIDAPLRLIEHVVMHDRPYSEIVTADYTLADRYVATVWGLPYDASGPEWQITHYEDGRPAAGILSDSYVFNRHATTYSNRNRGRANAMSTALLCFDFLSREIELDATIDLADDEAVRYAVQNNPACVSCHQTLDPLASYFAAYNPLFVGFNVESYPLRFLTPEYQSLLAVSQPAFFGQPSPDVSTLGEQIAHDPRFAACAARRFTSFLSQIPLNEVPVERVARLSELFVDSGMNARELARAVVLSDEFRTASSSDETEAEEVVGLMKARPEQLARSIEALTGYRWRTRLDFEIARAGNVGDRRARWRTLRGLRFERSRPRRR